MEFPCRNEEKSLSVHQKPQFRYTSDNYKSHHTSDKKLGFFNFDYMHVR